MVNCAKVTTSPESMIFGVFPVAVLGLAFYVFMVAVNSPWSWRPGMPLIRIARLAGVLTGIVFVLYLVYVELIQVNAICEYCTGVHVITFALFGLVMYSTAAHGLSGPGLAARSPRVASDRPPGSGFPARRESCGRLAVRVANYFPAI